MGNISFRRSNSTGKVILSDGTVHEFDKTLTVAELMLEHPQQVVVEFESITSEKRPTPLPADKKLDIKKVYLMLPMKRGKPASLSSEEARRILHQANSVLRSRPSILSSAHFLPLFARLCPGRMTGSSQCGFGFYNKKERFFSVESPPSEKKVVKPEFDLPEILDGRPEYLSRQFSGKGTWKPNLDTIKEKKSEKKVPHWLF